MLILNKILPVLVLPTGIVLLLLVVALVRKQRWPIPLAAGLLYICSMPLVGDYLQRSVEARYLPVPIERAPTADAIVALSGIFGPPAQDGYVLNVGEAGERLEAGILLWQHKKANWLVFTGGRVPWEKQPEVEGAVSARVAEARGVPAEKILVTEEAGNTAEEASAVAQLMHARGWGEIILVTSASHMRRAVRQFQNAGVSVVPFPVDFRVDPNRRLTILDFLPSAAGLQRTESSIRELYGTAFYAVAARLGGKR